METRKLDGTFEEDSELLKKMKEGDRVAFKTLFLKYYNRLCYFCCTLIEERQAAEDIVQTLFTDLWEKREKLQIHTSIKAYLFTAVKNRAFTAKLQAKSIVSEEAAEGTVATSPTPDKQIENNDLHEKLHHMISTLPEKARTVFIMKYLEGMKQKEIAKSLNLTENTIEKHLFNAKNRLRKMAVKFFLINLTFLLFH